MVVVGSYRLAAGGCCTSDDALGFMTYSTVLGGSVCVQI